MKSSTPGGNYPLSTAIAMSKTIVSVILLFSANFLSKRLRGNSLI
jgi:putative aldouronate transport system permease protein